MLPTGKTAKTKDNIDVPSNTFLVKKNNSGVLPNIDLRRKSLFYILPGYQESKEDSMSASNCTGTGVGLLNNKSSDDSESDVENETFKENPKKRLFSG